MFNETPIHMYSNKDHLFLDIFIRILFNFHLLMRPPQKKDHLGIKELSNQWRFMVEILKQWRTERLDVWDIHVYIKEEWKAKNTWV